MSLPTDDHLAADAVDLVTDAVEIADRTYWVGNRPPGEIQFSNPYLRCFEGAEKTFNLLVDPAASQDFAVVKAKIVETLGELEAIDAILINHQDPDISASVAHLRENYVPHAPVLSTVETGDLIHNYHDISDGDLVSLELYPQGMELPTGDVIIPLAVPFGHHRGATMVFDPASGVLYSGDLFSSLTDPEDDRLYANEDDWVGIRAFHQIFIPTRKVIEFALRQIESLDEPVKLIAPQHGRIIAGDQIEQVKSDLGNLSVGLDLLPGSDSDASDQCQSWTAVLDKVIETAEVEMPTVREVAQAVPVGDAVIWDGQRPKVQRQGRQVLEKMLRAICDQLSFKAANRVKYRALRATYARDLATPRLELDETKFKAGAKSMGGHPDFPAL